MLFQQGLNLLLFVVLSIYNSFIKEIKCEFNPRRILQNEPEHKQTPHREVGKISAQAKATKSMQMRKRIMRRL